MDLQAYALASGEAESGPETVWVYIEEMLSELAGLASANGAHTLATTITIAALEAARTEARLSPED